mmetsp:Transcript_9237/g.13496  ORF Transcript_9237/g.13496 Transcript_9237/m.13496 type:complete len:80 (-) Transcript_9237:3-242(-)
MITLRYWSTERNFRRNFRRTMEWRNKTFDELVDILRDKITFDEVKARNSASDKEFIYDNTIIPFQNYNSILLISIIPFS